MSAPNRKIPEFPYERRNAEKLIELAKKSVLAQYAFLECVNSYEIKGSSSGYMAYEDLSVVDFFMGFEELITGTFPELLPIDWGIDE